MRILFILGSLKAGGTETYLLRFLQNSSHKFAATIFVTSGSTFKGDLYNEYCSTKVRFKFMRLGHTNVLLWIRYYFYILFVRYDLICDFEGNFSGVRTFIAYCARVKRRVVFYRQTSDLFEKRVFYISINKLMNKLVFKYATDILSNSSSAFSVFFSNKTDSRFKVIYNGINYAIFENEQETKSKIRAELNIPQDAYVIGNTARFTPVKNHRTILKVFYKLVRKYSDIYLVLVGRDVKENLSLIVDDLNISDQIIFLGSRDDVPRVLRSFDLFYFPSLSEGQSNSLIEAMLSGLPFVTSNIQSILEMVPSFAYDQCIDPYDIDSSFEIIESYYLNGFDEMKVKSIKLFAKDRYNYIERFSEFERVLLNT